ncbi:SigE family RNA polymerase sigma factor [Actinacidiphila paucisporea]|uniref:SigE family RNA polymerase sigma factor n=1 Tax=Actinacidiphila paucisporea TaxID=310782 RepID=UPI000937E68E|nr:SigE family RNA polymerase sigma factor [Actinacidiphila paucisporea]
MWEGPFVGEGGFEGFVAARGQRLLRVAWLLTGDAHLAEDLLQTVLAKVWPKWHRIAEEDPEAYVRRALVHTHASWWRRRWRGEVPHGDLPDRALAQDAYAGVDLEQALAAAVRALPLRQRAVVVLRYFEDLSVTETAEVLGCSEGTVKSQAAKALRTLRGRLPVAVTADGGESP